MRCFTAFLFRSVSSFVYLWIFTSFSIWLFHLACVYSNCTRTIHRKPPVWETYRASTFQSSHTSISRVAVYTFNSRLIRKLKCYRIVYTVYHVKNAQRNWQTPEYNTFAFASLSLWLNPRQMKFRISCIVAVTLFGRTHTSKKAQQSTSRFNCNRYFFFF